MNSENNQKLEAEIDDDFKAYIVDYLITEEGVDPNEISIKDIKYDLSYESIIDKSDSEDENLLSDEDENIEKPLLVFNEDVDEEETDESDDAKSSLEPIDEPNEELVIDEPNEELVVDEVPKPSLRSVIKQRAEERHNRRLEKINIIKDQIESLKLRIASFH